jgi:tryptophan synthase alpha subunit
MHPDALFAVLREETAHPPVILMTYLNPVLAYGSERFFARASAG